MLRKTIFTIIILIIIATAVWISIDWYKFSHTPIIPVTEKSTTLIVEPGTSVHQFAKQLDKKGYYGHPHFLSLYARLHGYDKEIQSGEYLIDPTMSVKDLLLHIITGKQYVRKITLIEGWNFAQVRQALADEKHLLQLTDDINAKQIMAQLGHSNQHPEGRFFPATYSYTYGMSDLDILRKAYDKMSAVLENEWQSRSPKAPYQDAYQGLIVASLIEKETSLDGERPEVAGVIVHRLRKKMRLQIDPTVYYAVDKTYSEPLTKTDLRTSSPYNTYRVKGLPPTPICMPGLAAVAAAMHPRHTENLFYVANGKGGHYFSKTYHEHKKKVKKYRASLN